MNHNLVPIMLTDIPYENFFFFHMQNFFKCFEAQIETLPKLPIAPQQIQVKCGARTLAWNTEEDSILTSAVTERGPKYWSKVAKQINYQVHKGTQLRKGKHCRERWFNHLNPELNSKNYVENDWTHEEDELLALLQEERGNSWSFIAKALPGRTENSVRNRWNVLNKRKDKTNKE